MKQSEKDTPKPCFWVHLGTVVHRQHVWQACVCMCVCVCVCLCLCVPATCLAGLCVYVCVCVCLFVCETEREGLRVCFIPKVVIWLPAWWFNGLTDRVSLRVVAEEQRSFLLLLFCLVLYFSFLIILVPFPSYASYFLLLYFECVHRMLNWVTVNTVYNLDFNKSLSNINVVTCRLGLIQKLFRKTGVKLCTLM